MTFQDIFLDFSANAPLMYSTLLFTILLILKLFNLTSSPKIFLLDYSCYKPPTLQVCSKEKFMEKFTRYSNISKENLEFMKTSLERSGLGQSTYISEALAADPPKICLEEARKESEMVVFGAIDELLGKTGVKGSDIRIVILNCSVFNVVPSLCSVIVNRYKLRDDVLTYNLTGMGCSAGLLAIGLAKNLLQVHQDCYALVVSTENITENVYKGEDRSKLVSNCIFRVGGSVVLLSNRPSDQETAKYRLLHTAHTNTASNDESHNCLFEEEDTLGNRGINITNSLLLAANATIKANMAELGHMVLPVSDQLRYLASRALTRLGVETYIPNLKSVVEHIFPHVGGRPVLDEMQRHLSLSEADMEASRMTLYRFGNTSSSSIWYEVAYAEAKGKVKKSDRVWQIGYGSGFKCSSVIWEAIRSIDFEEANPWSDEIDEFPVEQSVLEPAPYVFKPVVALD